MLVTKGLHCESPILHNFVVLDALFGLGSGCNFSRWEASLHLLGGMMAESLETGWAVKRGSTRGA